MKDRDSINNNTLLTHLLYNVPQDSSQEIQTIKNNIKIILF